MRIKAVVLENFRAYKQRTTVPMSSLTAFIGKNDAGKSTILEALDIFFEGGTVELDPADASKGGDPQNVRIGVVFDALPAQLILDSDAPTTLAAEYLLNSGGDLEIHKIFNCAKQKPSAVVVACARHPTAKGVSDLVQKNQKDLKAAVKSLGLEAKCNQAQNPSMRQAIYQAETDLKLADREVPLNEANGKAIWSALQRFTPIFALFQSDRPSNDQDPEVQNPMKVAIKLALDQLAAQLEQVTEEVQKRAQETANRTLAKLQASYPDLASTLTPKFKKPSWNSVFKLDLEGDDNIPLNKRGSGVRRLILLSFFQAEAERKRAESPGAIGGGKSIVYAIEEPETSQHPDNQEQIISVLKQVAAAGDQVIMTTHVPGLAQLIPLESLRYVDRDPSTNAIRVREGTDQVYEEVAEALGVLPNPVERDDLKVAVLVEGKTDIDALRALAKILHGAGQLPNWDDAKIFWTIGGGDTTLMDWIERRYLDRLNLPQVIIQDSDRTSPNLPPSVKKQTWLTDMQGLSHVTAFLTEKRAMENYLHPDTIDRATNGVVKFAATVDLNFDKLEVELAKLLTAARAANSCPTFQPKEANGNLIRKTDAGACKKIICGYLMTLMTEAEIAHRASIGSAGGTRNEVVDWLSAIAAHL